MKTDFNRQRLEKQQNNLQSQLHTRDEKLARLRWNLVIETAAAVKFQLEKQIQVEEEEIKRLEGKLSSIEQALTGTIETGVREPSLKYQQNLNEYKQAVIEVLEHEYPLTTNSLQHLKRLRDILALENEDADLLKAQAIEQLCIDRAEYQKNLQQYQNEFCQFVRQEHPFSYYTRNQLKQRQQSLGIKDEDTSLIEKKAIEQLKELYQKNFQRYQQEFFREVQQEYPFTPYAQKRLKKLQQSLQLKDEDVLPVEKQITTQFTPIKPETNLPPVLPSLEAPPDEWFKEQRPKWFQSLDSLLDDR